MRNSRLQKMVSVALLAAMGVVLQMVSIPIIPAFSFLKMDFSDIPVMIGMFVYGPIAGLATAFIRSAVHLAITGFSFDNMIGDAAAFFASSLFTLPMFYFFRKRDSLRFNKAIGVFSGILLLTVFMSIANYFVITPLYLKAFGVTADKFLGMSLANYVLIGIVPFNLLKGTIVSAVFLMLHAKLLPWLTRRQNQLNHTIQQ